MFDILKAIVYLMVAASVLWELPGRWKRYRETKGKADLVLIIAGLVLLPCAVILTIGIWV